MKILEIVAAYKPAFVYGGPTMSVSKLCEVLIAQDSKPDLEVLTTTANGKSELNVKPNSPTEIDGVKVTYFNRITKDHTHFSPALLLALWRKIKAQNSPLIIHIHAWWNLVSIFSCYVAKWYNIPVILSPRGMLTTYTATNRNVGIKLIIHKAIGKGLLKYCHIHATSEQEKHDVLTFVQPKSITVIPNLVELPFLGQRITSNDQQTTTFNLLFLSRIEEKKGLELLFEALINLSFSWQLTIAGSGEENYVESLKAKAESLKLTQQIIWLGHVNNENKFQLIAHHDLLVLTSYNENFANVVIESLSVGTAVLLSNQVGLANYVQEKKLGWISTLQADDISQKLNLAYQSLGERAMIREEGPIIIKYDFGETNLAQKYIHLYETTLHE